MREGTRKAIFSYLVHSIPFGTSKEGSSHGAGEAVISMLIANYRQDCEARFLKSFADYYTKGTYDERGNAIIPSERKIAQTVEEAVEHCSVFKTVADAVKWGAETMYMKELEEGVAWLVSEGYMKEHKRPARFGYKWTFSITDKGWKIAHLYR